MEDILQIEISQEQKYKYGTISLNWQSLYELNS
jgi:hypothetical protein